MRFQSLLPAALACLVVVPGCDSEENGTVGRPCADDLECGPEGQAYCGLGFTQLAGDDTPADDADSLGVIGLMMPPGVGYCMHTAGCTTDAECPNGSACFLPLADVATGDLAGVGFSASDLSAGHCLVPCDTEAQCRTADGFTCGIPLEEELAGIPGVRQDTFCIPAPVVKDPCAPNAAWNAAGTCTLTYDIDGSFEISGTPLGAGDKIYPIGPGTVVLRVPSSDGVAPSDGTANVLCYDLRQQFGTTNAVFTVVRAYSVDPGGAPRSSGTLTAGRITWDACAPSASYCSETDPWTPTDAATGAGCLTEYTSVGDVYCGYSTLCPVGMLTRGHNPQDDQWSQPLHPFDFSGGDGFDAIAMGGPAVPDTTCGMLADWVDDKVQIPNDSPGRTWLSIAGTLRTMDCTAP